MNGTSFDLPLFVAVMGAAAMVSSYLVVKTKDLVYASVSLAVLGSLTAAVLALLGLGVVAAYIVLVYVGAAVMFIIITISMLGPSGREEYDTFKGVISATVVGMFVLLLVFSLKLYDLYAVPTYLSVQVAASEALRRYLPVLALIFIGQAVTVVEAIAIARKGEGP
ncbi:MAG: NADH-quinone oxidoreductase subunit J family protein [Acidilobus sp.]